MRNTRVMKLLVLLLALCLLSGGSAALAEEVSVVPGEKDGEVKAEVQDDLESNANNALRVFQDPEHADDGNGGEPDGGGEPGEGEGEDGGGQEPFH